MNNKLHLFIGFLLLCSSTIWAQTIKITGVVSDKMGPITGATVMVKNTTLGTATDIDGNYSIEAPSDGTLVFSYIGYTPIEKRVNNQTTINVELIEDIMAIDEIVVTAIGIKQQKKKIGYSVQQINIDVLNATPSMNVGSALSGQVAGLTVANPTGLFQAPSFKLRGNSPLIVLDGVPVETDFFDISSENIESINVLKGTSASALYGSRGKNGAIMITSKSAKKEGIEINFSTNNMMTAGFAVLPETQHEYGSGSNGKYEFWDGADGGISDGDMTWGPKLNAGLKIAQWNSPVRDKVTGVEIPWWGDVQGTQYDDKSRYERVPIDWVSHDNLKDFLETGLVTNNNISIAYKGEKARYLLTGQYAFQKGQVPSTKLHSGGLNFNSSFDLAKNLQLDANLAYNKVLSPSYPRYGYGPRNHMYTIVVWMGDDVNGKDLKKHQYVPGKEGYRQANYNYAWYNNPYFAAEELQQTESRDVVNGQLRLNYQLLPNLNLQGRAAVREKTTLQEMKVPKTYMNYGDSREGDYKVWNYHQTNVDADFLANYTQSLTADILFTLNAGTSVFYRRYRKEYQSSDGLVVPYVYSINNSQGPVIAEAERTEKEIRSAYGAVNLDFYEYVFLTLTGRNDWSSTLAKNNNSYFYPSVALSTMVSEYVKLPQFMDYMKIYGSWAVVSTDLSPYQIMATYTKENSYGSTPSVSYPSSMVNYYIKPQKTTSWEAGLSTAMLRNRISLDLTYYRTIDENQIIDLEISNASGFAKRKVNGNQYTTDGWEVMANIQAVRAKEFQWDFALNWSRSVKTLTEIYGGQEKFGNLKVGDRADAFYGSQWTKSKDGEVILDQNGMPTKDAYNQYLGHLEPKFRMGMQHTFRYNNFTMAIDLDGAYKGVIYSVLSEKLWWGGKHPNSVEYRAEQYAAGTPVYVPDGVVVTGGELTRDIDGNVISDTRTYKKNTTAVDWQQWCHNYPYRAYVSYKENEKFANVFDRSYIKLRRVAVTYDFTNMLSKSGPVKGLTVTAFGNNLAIWKKVPFVDPDYTGDSNDEGANDPTARYIGVGMNIKF
ncbi:MAG: SusC/RagA family TonB-linked outer membrane protein [Tannerella sp.]|jgi:TonB-linked SusC/RagA family outer membrane protein|nr:SusC/RagA family TonB-linked outer membrane protein [Tannerella sp.]